MFSLCVDIVFATYGSGNVFILAQRRDIIEKYYARALVYVNAWRKISLYFISYFYILLFLSNKLTEFFIISRLVFLRSENAIDSLREIGDY